jgi:hypothetical protein
MLVAAIALLIVFTQAVPDVPVRLGYTGRHVSDLDVADLAAALSVDSADIWLVFGHSPSMLNQPTWYVGVFLPLTAQPNACDAENGDRACCSHRTGHGMRTQALG